MRVTLALIIALFALFLVARLRYPGKPPVKLPASECNADLWKHVYQAERLRLIEGCTAVEGRVVSVRHANDGDLHIGLDPDRKSALNLINVMHSDSRLVVEIVCDHTSADKAPETACAGFTSQVAAPRVGDRVRVIGAYVTDSEYGWNEINPVTRIEVLP